MCGSNGSAGSECILCSQEGGRVTITNDGATVISLLEIVHPAAHTLVDIARSQDAEVRISLLCFGSGLP